LINIAGLATGITAFLFILLFVKYERSFDAYHKNFNNIYRLRYERSSVTGESVKFASCCPPAAIRIRELYPEVEKIGRIFRYRAAVIFGDRNLRGRMHFACQIFDIFDIQFITGSPSSESPQRTVPTSNARNILVRTIR
jgi:putative ABC transport system permease protein